MTLPNPLNSNTSLFDIGNLGATDKAEEAWTRLQAFSLYRPEAIDEGDLLQESPENKIANCLLHRYYCS